MPLLLPVVSLRPLPMTKSSSPSLLMSPALAICQPCRVWPDTFSAMMAKPPVPTKSVRLEPKLGMTDDTLTALPLVLPNTT